MIFLFGRFSGVSGVKPLIPVAQREISSEAKKVPFVYAGL